MSKKPRERSGDISQQIEEGLGGEARLRILKVLSKTPSRAKALTKYKISILTGLKAKDVDRHLNRLVETRWVQCIQMNDLKEFKLNSENPNVSYLVDFFTKAKYI
jgi:hypothetical protein